jgi:hypothetical protein
VGDVRRRARWWLCAGMAAGLMGLPACREGSGTDIPPTAETEPEVQRSYSSVCELGGGSVMCGVRLSVNKVSATVADRIELVMEAAAPSGVRVEWPEIGAALGGLDVLGVEEASFSPGDGRVGERRVVLLEAFLPGDRELPRMEVRFVDAGGASCVVATEAVKIAVASLLEGEAGAGAEPALRGVVEPEPEGTPWWVWGAGAVVVLGVAGLTALALRRRGGRAPVALTPYAAAMKRLGELEASGVEEATVGSYCAALGETLRQYLPGALGLPARDRTTEELMAEVGDDATVNTARVREVLTRLDEVSFGGSRSGVAESLELRDAVHKLVMGIQAGRTALATGGVRDGV